MSRVKDVVLFCINACSKIEFIKTIKNNIKIHNQGSVAWPLENDKLACVALTKRPFYTFIFSPPSRLPFSREALQRPLIWEASQRGNIFRRHWSVSVCFPPHRKWLRGVIGIYLSCMSSFHIHWTWVDITWIWHGAILHIPPPKQLCVALIESKGRENKSQ